MTPEAQRIVIAEACGWQLDKLQQSKYHSMSFGVDALQYSYVWLAPNGKTKYKECPDYLNDLNAMHEAYLYLVSISRPASARRQPDVTFNLRLMEICNPGEQLWDNGTFLGNHWNALEAVNASAAQRAEALLRTLNL